MNVQSEKFRLIEWLVSLNDMGTLEKLSQVRKESIKDAYESGLKPMSPEELTDRALVSNKNIEEGEVYDIESVLESNKP